MNRSQWSRLDSARLAHVELALEHIRQGKMVILVDDEDRENEGDLVLAAEKVTADTINFMAKYARGLICLALDESMVERLALPMMVEKNTASLGTAFTVSIEARHGVSTGISAADRAHTIQVAVASNARPSDLVSPGHVFPLKAKPGGVLQRTGQTEGSVDLARLAGCSPAGVICEIMNDDGSMARRPDLEQFAQQHNLIILTIADLIQYRLQTESLVRRVQETPIQLDGMQLKWTALVYEVAVEQRQFLAFVCGDIIDSKNPILCRVHSGSIIGDVFASTPFEGGNNLRTAMTHIEQEGCGVILYVPGRGNLLRELDAYVAAHSPQHDDKHLPEPALREFGLGAQCLVDMGLRQIRLLTNNPRKIVGLDGYGLEVVERVALWV